MLPAVVFLPALSLVILQVNPLTVWGLLASLSKSESWTGAESQKWVINTAGGSALGRQLIAVAKHQHNLKVVAVVRRAEQKKELLAAGCVLHNHLKPSMQSTSAAALVHRMFHLI